MHPKLTAKEKVVMSRLTGSGPIDWIRANTLLIESDPVSALYDRTESQSGGSLPGVYEPFNGRRRGHFTDRGQILDFATAVGGGRVLDFGPGDGWPSLMMAPMVGEVVGVDASPRRVEVCTRNARRLGLDEVQFLLVRQGQHLPFEDNSFDGVTAASSIEQTPDPKATLAELCRVLSPGGALRMSYEALGQYRHGRERAIWLADLEGMTSLVVFDRHVDEEWVRHYALMLSLERPDVARVFERAGVEPTYAGLTPSVLSALRTHVVEAATWTTQHPSCRTWLGWLKDAGFASAKATHDGGRLARGLFDQVPPVRRPRKIEDIDDWLRPVVEVVHQMEAPSDARSRDRGPWITAIK